MIIYHHAIIYGIELNNLEDVLLEVNPKWEGASVRASPHWIKSNTKSSDLQSDEDRESFRQRSGNNDLLIGYVFPDGSIDRNVVEAGFLNHPMEDGLGGMCYLNDMARQTLGKLILYDSAAESWHPKSSPANLVHFLSNPNALARTINDYGFDIKPSDLKIVQVFFTTYD